MKKTYLNILAILAISSLATSQALADFILRNKYGADIEYMSGNSNVKNLANEQSEQLNNEQSLSLRTINGKFTDVSMDLKKLIYQANNEQPYHFDETPVITINSNPLYWSLSLSWQ